MFGNVSKNSEFSRLTTLKRRSAMKTGQDIIS